MQIKFEIKIPENLEGDEKEERIKFDLENAIFRIHNLIQESERKNIKVKDGNGFFNKYESFAQIEEMYRRDGKISLFYIGPDYKFEK